MCSSLKRLSEMMQSSKARLRIAPSFLKRDLYSLFDMSVRSHLSREETDLLNFS